MIRRFAPFFLLAGAAAQTVTRPVRVLPTRPQVQAADTQVLELTGREKAYPPTPKAVANIVPVRSVPVPSPLAAMKPALRSAALADERVKKELGARYAYISASQVEPEGPAGGPVGARLMFFSYSTNTAVEVWMDGTEVTRVTARPGHRPQPGNGEIQAAIALARTHPALGPAVQGFESGAMLPSARLSKTYGNHRVLYVTFWPDNNTRRLYSALVDLTDQKVLDVNIPKG